MRSDANARRARYVSASELAEYAFCPRAHYYRLHSEGRPVSSDASARERAGVTYHRRTLSSDRRWAGAALWPWGVTLLVGVVILTVAVLGDVP
ncbi:MAG TPA: hypothetical protein VJQ43_02070 [Thermoplasmata archaeon]|nr:hypothetical protein [Thermoplasmata archaeon]